MPPDPAAVAARQKAKERNEWYLMVLGLSVFGVVGTLVAIKFVKEAGEAVAARNRPKQPWDIE